MPFDGCANVLLDTSASGFLPGSMSVHYDGNPTHRPVYGGERAVPDDIREFRAERYRAAGRR
jgi:hypothetical protein